MLECWLYLLQDLKIIMTNCLDTRELWVTLDLSYFSRSEQQNDPRLASRNHNTKKEDTLQTLVYKKEK